MWRLPFDKPGLIRRIRDGSRDVSCDGNRVATSKHPVGSFVRAGFYWHYPSCSWPDWIMQDIYSALNLTLHDTNITARCLHHTGRRERKRMHHRFILYCTLYWNSAITLLDLSIKLTETNIMTPCLYHIWQWERKQIHRRVIQHCTSMTLFVTLFDSSFKLSFLFRERTLLMCTISCICQ